MIELITLIGNQGAPVQKVRIEEARQAQSMQTTIASGSGTIFPTIKTSAAEALTVKAVALPVTKWTNALEREFVDLAANAAVGEASENDISRLKNLQATRRRLKHPRTGEEVIWEYKQRVVTQKLVSALRDYVHFHSESNNPWAGAKENI